jgi:Flp pilus assembly protein TadD
VSIVKDLIALAADAIVVGRIEEAAEAMTRFSRGEPAFELRCDPMPVPFSVVKWRIGDGCGVISLSDALPLGRRPFFTRRLVQTLPLLVHYHRTGRERGTIYLGLDDNGAAPGLAFCTNADQRFLIPDPLFLQSQGYQTVRKYFSDEPVAWDDRRPVAFWRGSTSGNRAGGSWRTLPRVRLCEIGRAPEAAEFFEVGISRVSARTEAEASAIKSSGLMREWVPATAFARYRMQIDIDGNTNSWPGLFQKLLTGSPVLKVASPGNFRQWYYDRLVAWENYVPVEADMRDLVDKVRWLLSHDGEAREIGRRGAVLAGAMTYEAELEHAVATIEDAVRRAPQDASMATGGEPDIVERTRTMLPSAEHREGVEGMRDQVTVLLPHGPSVRERLARILGDRGRIEEVVAELANEVNTEPGAAQFHATLSRYLGGRGRIGEAITAIKEAIAIEPGNAVFHDALSQHLACEGRIEEAVAAASEAVAIDPGNSHLWGHLGPLLSRQGDLAGAEAALRRAVELSPPNPHFHAQLAEVLARRGRSDEALSALQRAIEMEPRKAGFRNALSHYLARQGRTEEAIAAAEEAVSIDPGNSRLWGHLGGLLSRRGDGGGEAALRRAKELSPDPRVDPPLAEALTRQDSPR